MRKEIQYRDLPGGPLMVKFADELPLCALCSKCGMLSKDMFEDPSSHAFCSICIFECSDRKKIHCKYENKDVSVEEMMPAIDIINVVMDQVVFCPNMSDGNSCTKYCTLKDLKKHYLECEKTEIICLSCGDTVRGRDWQTHVTSCPQQIMQCRYCVVAVPRFRLELHERLCSYNPNAVREADTSPTAAMNFTSQRRSDWARNEQQLPVSAKTNKPHLIPEPKPSDLSKVDDNARLSCPICNRNVKSKNMDKHISVCLQRSNGPSSPEARQRPEIAPVLPTPGAAPIRAPGQEYPQHESQERVLPAVPILLPTLEGHPNEHALPTRHHVAPRASMQPDYNFQRQMFAQPASPIPHIAPGERRPGILGDCNGVRQGGGDVQLAVHHNLENKPSQSEATTAEVAAVASDMGSLLSSYEMLSHSDVPTDDITEHGLYSGVRQEGGYSQMAESNIVQTQPSRSEEAPTEAPGSWFNFWNYASLGHYLRTRQGGGCSETATGYIAGTQSSRSEETSGHCIEDGQEAGCSQMAASESVQTPPSRSEETPVLHDVRKEMHPSPESAEPNEKTALVVEARRDAFSTYEKIQRSFFCFSFIRK
ncbi:uncharacterized protein [Dermacentor albipictus]|uniref:uncharacterized protein isoform X5 n=1 Tax=Dermacentor albipictus TaxID=60249 RepID=UPI0038FD16DB